MAFILKPLEKGKLKLTNRLVLPPMATSKSDENGKISDDILAYYDEKSRGGYIGLIIIEHSFITQQGKASDGQLSVASDDMVEGLKKLANIIHKNGSKAVMQINHAGGAAKTVVTGMESVSSSAVENVRLKTTPKELTKEEINQIVDDFRDASVRVKEAGFDGVEIHSAHGYLLNQFYSPLGNKRTDEYGGDLMGRIKILLEVVKAVRQAVGEEFPILLRLGASDYTEGGTTIEDSKIAAVELEKAGVDMLDISGGFCGYLADEVDNQGYFSVLTQPLMQVLSIPVILTGGITDIQAAEQLLADEKADLIGVGRVIYKDSTWAEKVMTSLK